MCSSCGFVPAASPVSQRVHDGPGSAWSDEIGDLGLSWPQAEEVAIRTYAASLRHCLHEEGSAAAIDLVGTFTAQMDPSDPPYWLRGDAVVIRMVDGALFWRCFDEAGITDDLPKPLVAGGGGFVVLAGDYILEAASTSDLVARLNAPWPARADRVEVACSRLQSSDSGDWEDEFQSADGVIGRLQALLVLGLSPDRAGGRGAGRAFARRFNGYLERRLRLIVPEVFDDHATSTSCPAGTVTPAPKAEASDLGLGSREFPKDGGFPPRQTPSGQG